ncbi:hypothetical protein ACKKBG_A00065 [Auxenochlorella protothecoides x Auxenochlorella symbiontica]
MTSYTDEVARIKNGVLEALGTRTSVDDVGRVAVSLLLAQPSEEGASLKPLSPTQHTLFGNGLQVVVSSLLDAALEEGTPAMEYKLSSAAKVPSLRLLLDASLSLALQGVTHGGIPAALLEQVFDSLTVAECEVPFAYLEERLSDFKQPAVRARAALTLQRACNLLIHRLSKSQNSLFAGRLLIFLAKLLPLMERSGVNLQGAFHTENSTPVEDVAEGALDSLGKTVDAEFYGTFWSLQAAFSNPPQAGIEWSETARAVKIVLERLKKDPVTLTEAASGSSISAKYLSGSRLLSLQLRDATFRRHFLVQCLILFQFLEAPHAAKQAWPVLKGRQIEELKALQESVYESLASVPERGPEFAATIRQLLLDESSWAAWKQASCPKEAFERPAAAPPAAAKTTDPLGPPFKRRKPSRDAVFGVTLGTEELDRLWNLTEDNLSGLAAEDRGGFKTVSQLMEPVLEEMTDPEAPSLSKSTMYSWRTLRMVARVNLRAFVASVQAKGDLQVAARIMYPNRCPEPAGAGTASSGEAQEGGKQEDVEMAEASAAPVASPSAGGGLAASDAGDGEEGRSDADAGLLGAVAEGEAGPETASEDGQIGGGRGPRGDEADSPRTGPNGDERAGSGSPAPGSQAASGEDPSGPAGDAEMEP